MGEMPIPQTIQYIVIPNRLPTGTILTLPRAHMVLAVAMFQQPTPLGHDPSGMVPGKKEPGSLHRLGKATLKDMASVIVGPGDGTGLNHNPLLRVFLDLVNEFKGRGPIKNTMQFNVKFLIPGLGFQIKV